MAITVTISTRTPYHHAYCNTLAIHTPDASTLPTNTHREALHSGPEGEHLLEELLTAAQGLVSSTWQRVAVLPNP